MIQPYYVFVKRVVYRCASQGTIKSRIALQVELSVQYLVEPTRLGSFKYSYLSSLVFYSSC
jgi:hypothetical protein